MKHDIIEEFQDRPSVMAYMVRAFIPSLGLRKNGEFPRIVERWSNIHINSRHLRSFVEMTGLPAGDRISLIYPHVFGFPLQMALLTHRTFPFPIWRALQIRNHLLLRRPFSENEILDLETRVAGYRILAKGVEVDLYTTLSSAGERAWEGLNTFYFRGHYGPAQEASPLAQPLSGEWLELTRWHMSPGVGWRFAGLTGDYNGIHWQNWYARLFGFRSAFSHPQLVLSQCLKRLSPPASTSQRLDVWLKGPVYYDTDVRLGVATSPEGEWFNLSMDGKELPSIVGRWYTVSPETRLIDELDAPLPLGHGNKVKELQ
jgi:hypothetical protein